MPYISVECGQLQDSQKRELIQRLTEVSSEITNVPPQFFTIVIHEVPDQNFGIGGKTIDVVKSEFRRTHS